MKIMVIDDDQTLRECLVDIFYEKLGSDIEVVGASNGLEAKTKLEEMNISPDIIITDFNMPNMNGLELARYLKENSELAEIPIIMMSADSATVRQSAEALGCRFIEKPFPIENLIEQIFS